MKYEQYIKRVEEGDLIAKYENQPITVIVKDDLYVTTNDGKCHSYLDIKWLWKKDSKGSYNPVEVER